VPWRRLYGGGRRRNDGLKVRVLIFLLPVFALGLVAAAIGTAVVLRDSEGAPASTTTPQAPEVTPSPEGSALPRLTPGQNVCQGLLHVPDPSQPRAFPAEYTQRRDVLGFTILAMASVPAEALDVAVATVEDVFRLEETRLPLVEAGAYIVVADRGQRPQDLPEFKCLVEVYGEAFFTHVCGIADRADYPVVTVNAADLLGERDGPCRGLNVLYHELGHLVHGWVLSPAEYLDVRIYYQDAVDSGRYGGGAYAMTNPGEYFAEGTQAYFTRNDRLPRDAAWLRENDPQLYGLLQQYYGKR
jgi:hypothetical protein